jgi:hypothetical protein
LYLRDEQADYKQGCVHAKPSAYRCTYIFIIDVHISDIVVGICNSIKLYVFK